MRKTQALSAPVVAILSSAMLIAVFAGAPAREWDRDEDECRAPKVCIDAPAPCPTCVCDCVGRTINVTIPPNACVCAPTIEACSTPPSTGDFKHCKRAYGRYWCWGR